MPDFDIDFCQDRREEVIRYVQQKYGREQVAQIITFGSLQARAVLRDVGRVLEMPYGQVDKICKLVPQQSGQPDAAVEGDRGGAEAAGRGGEEPVVARLLDIAQKIEGSIATPRPTPPASSSATGRCRSWCRCTAIRAPTCRSPSST
jgi:DNA polymerase-3 subunit alpha